MKTFNDVWTSVDGKEWVCVNGDAPWMARRWAMATAHDGELWLTAGFSNLHAANLSESWATKDGVAWREMRRPPWVGRHEHAAYSHDGSLWVVAGNTWPLLIIYVQCSILMGILTIT